MDLSVLSQLGGHSAKRTHRNKSGPNVGFAIISALQKKMAEFHNIEVITGASAEAFVFTNQPEDRQERSRTKVTGVKLHKQDGSRVVVDTSSVILATGGYSANKQMLHKFAPGMETFPTTNGPFALGDGIGLAETLGADFVLMDKVQLHPTGFINPKDRDAGHRFLAPEAVRGSGALLFNAHGKRFVNELATRDVVSKAMMEQPNKMAFMLLFEGIQPLESSFGFYKHIGLVKQVKSVTEAANYCNMDAQTVLNELNAYAEVVHEGKADAFGKTVFPYPISHIESVDTPIDIHVMEVSPVVHYCMGTCPTMVFKAPSVGFMG